MKLITCQLIALLLLSSYAPAGENPPASAPIPVEAKVNFLKRKVSANVFVDPDYYIWGMSVIKWKDGKYHGYYARWPKHTKSAGWMTHCEIAHAIADKPQGPFKHLGVVIGSRHLQGWDVVNAHNPSVCVENGKIHIYYISNRLRGDYKATKEHPYPSDKWMKKNRINIVRNRQCVGVATATQPNGPFVRAPRPVVEPDGKHFKNIAVNPAVTYHDGKFVMIVKGDDVHKKGWFRIQLVGHADKAEGPFTFQEKPIYDKAQTEDACIWYDETQAQFHSLIHVMGKPFLAHLVSEDGYKWSEAKPFAVMQKAFSLANGKIWKPSRVERPFVLTNEKGQPQWLYCGTAVGNKWGNVACPFPPRK